MKKYRLAKPNLWVKRIGGKSQSEQLRQNPGGIAVPKGADERIFALDIGTRSVIGLIAKKGEEKLIIEAVAIEEYQSRAVVDGQIEDIRETAKIAMKVKQRLEEKTGTTLTQVYIAAAGRVLKTGEAEYEAEVPGGRAIDAPLIAKMEFAAVQKVYEQLMEQEENQTHTFLCVGHSAVRYRLDDYEFSTLIGHKGKKAAIKVIATFLPKEVVDSLNSTMARIGLAVAGLTLEPIAAMNVVIPSDLRKLNLALVDIGAGTADIALCEKGSVSAYTMATVAGDEITEAIMESCLVDFQTAEELKRKLDQEAPLSYANILGFPMEISGSDLYSQIQTVVEYLAQVVADKILSINKRPPAAVFLVGGASQVPHLRQLVAQKLGMEENRVAVGGSMNMKKMVASDEAVFGPEFATPVGIALTASLREKEKAFSLMVNEEKVPLLGGWEMTVLDALQLAGYKYSQIMGRAGHSLIYEVNGQRRSKRGDLPQGAVIFCNGQPAALGDAVGPGDRIEFQPALNGADASLTIEELMDTINIIPVMINGVNYSAGATVYVNGRPAVPGQLIRSMDSIKGKTIGTLDDLCQDLKINLQLYEIFINDKKESGTYTLNKGDYIETRLRKQNESIQLAVEVMDKPAAVDETAAQAPVQEEEEDFSAAGSEAEISIAVEVAAVSLSDAEPAPMPAAQAESGAAAGAAGSESADGGAEAAAPRSDGTADEKKGSLFVYLNGQPMYLPPKADGMPHFFVDMFSYVDIDTQNPQGNLVQTVNGEEAPYLQELFARDEICIHWSEAE